MGHFIANKSVQKLFQIGDRLALTTAGLVGHAQSLSRTLSAEVALFELRRQQPMTVKGAATLTANILSGRPHWVQLLIVGVDEDGGHVYSIDSAGGSIPDVYCATGSGSPYMYGVLEDGFKPDMTEAEALKLAARASTHRDKEMQPLVMAWISLLLPKKMDLFYKLKIKLTSCLLELIFPQFSALCLTHVLLDCGY